MYTAKLTVLGVEIVFDAQDEQGLWRKLALFHGVPAVCPIDDTPVKFFHKAPEGNDYFEVRNTGAHLFECAFGQYKDKSGLFPKGVWSWWDWERKQDIVLYENGKLTEAGAAMRKRCIGSVAVAATNGVHADGSTELAEVDNPSRYPESLADVPEMPGGTVSAPQGDHRKPGQVGEAQLNTIHALGQAFYGDKSAWDAKRPELVAAFSKKRTVSSAEMWVAEAAAMQAKLEEKLRIAYAQVAEGWPSPFDLEDIDSLHGVELANAMKKLRALVAAPQAAQAKKNAVAAIRN